MLPKHRRDGRQDHSHVETCLTQVTSFEPKIGHHLISRLHSANKDQRHTVAWARRRPNPMQSIYAIMPPTGSEQAELRERMAQPKDRATSQTVRLLPAGRCAYPLVNDRVAKARHPRALECLDDGVACLLYDARSGGLDGLGGEAFW